MEFLKGREVVRILFEAAKIHVTDYLVLQSRCWHMEKYDAFAPVMTVYRPCIMLII